MSSFDDSSWLAATEYGSLANAQTKFPNIDDNAQWIWTSEDKADNEVYFRLSLSAAKLCTAKKNYLCNIF